MSADLFSYKDDVYVALAVPNSDSCIIMEWDHIETHFRPFDNITGLIIGHVMRTGSGPCEVCDVCVIPLQAAR